MLYQNSYAHIAKSFAPDFRLLKIPNEEAQLFAQRIAKIAANCSPLPASFFNLTKVISDHCRKHDIHFKDGYKHVLNNPQEMFDHFGIPTKPDPGRIPKFLHQTQVRKQHPGIPTDVKLADFFHPDNIEHAARECIRQSGSEINPRLKKIDYGVFKNSGVTWKFLDEAFRYGALNLHETGCATLIDFLVCRKVITPTLSWQYIEQTARATVAATGARMTQSGGMIEHGPLKGVMTEAAVHLSIRDGYHGLKKGLFKGLKDFQDQCGIPAASNNKGYTRGEVIRLSDLAIALRMTHMIDKHRLNKNDGVIKYGPLAGENCLAVDNALKHGYRGLRGCGFDGISAYADYLKIPRDPHHASSLSARLKKARFSLEDAEESINLHITHDQKVPIADKTLVRLGPLAKLNITFAAVNICIARQKDIHGYGGMKDLMEDRCGETAFWHAPESKLAKHFAAGVGVDYDTARHAASFNIAAFFMGPPAPRPQPQPEYFSSSRALVLVK